MSMSPPEATFAANARSCRQPIKLNLYRGYEVAAVAAAMAESAFPLSPPTRLDVRERLALADVEPWHE